MANALLVVAIIAAAGFCPLMMWWNARRGSASACCAPTRAEDATPSVPDLRRRLAKLDTEIAARDAEPQAPA